MSTLWIEPSVVPRLAVAIRFVDRFTGRPVSERQEVNLVGQDQWLPVFRQEDSTYRFVVSNAEVPALGAVDVKVSPVGADSRYRDHLGFQVTIPPPGPLPVPLTPAHYLVERPLWPTRALRPPAGETAVTGRLLRLDQPLPDHRVLLRAGGPPLPSTPEAYTDEHGEFLFRFPDLHIQVVGANVVDTADLFVSVTTAAGVPLVLAAPPVPITIPMGQVSEITLTVN